VKRIKLDDKTQKGIISKVESFIHDPLGFTLWAYPWGEDDSVLCDEDGPEEWQVKIMQDIEHGLKNGFIWNNGRKLDCSTGIRIAVKSGHGIGKTALMTWLDQWFISTHPNPGMRTTANTKDQLQTTTWREMSKWHKLLINAHWFKWTATKFICLASPSTWFSPAIPQSENNSQAFAGLHEKHVMVKYDEASEIPDVIWEVTEGAMTDASGTKIWIVFGNPSMTTGRFVECWGKFRDMWATYEIDSRTVKRTDKKLIQKWIDSYGEDSDFVRVRVKGQTPRSAVTQFIPDDIVANAMGKVIHPSEYSSRARIMGVDIARFGDDQTVFMKRQGTAMYGLQKHRNLNTQSVAGLIAAEIQGWEPDMVFLDMGNIGASVYDMLVDWGYKDVVTGVWFGSSADDKTVYFNKRIEMVGRYKEWLENGGAIPDDKELRDDSVQPSYAFTGKEQFQLESAEDMKKRGCSSPDCLMSAALTFAYPVERREGKSKFSRGSRVAHSEYDMFQRPASNPRSVTDYEMFS